MERIQFRNVQVFDGTGSACFPADVLIEGERVHAVLRGPQAPPGPNTLVVDGSNATLMPGLVEAHAHLSWPSAVDRLIPTLRLPPEEAVLVTARNARVLLDHGFTSAYSAGALGKRYEVAVRNEINGGWIPGPRLKASSIERQPPSATDSPLRSQTEQARGPEALRAFIKECADNGIDTVKMLLSGEDALMPGASQQLLYTDEEVAAAADQARQCNIWLAAHAQAAQAVKLAVRHGFRMIYHCSYADEEAIELLVAHKDELFMAPAIGVIVATLEATPPPHFSMKVMKEAAPPVIENCRRLIPELHRRGVRVLPGGDYGFPFNPNGRNARDLQHFVELFGYTPLEALQAATQLGGELMGMGSELGCVQGGFLADLLLVRGDPTHDVSLLQNPDNLLAIMKNGVFHKPPPEQRVSVPQRARA